MHRLRSLTHLAIPCLLAAALTLVGLPAHAQVALSSTDLRLASDGTGAGSLAVCVEEDSADTAAFDAEVPAPGGVFYYVVKPNGIHGRYGADSVGRPRLDANRACEE